MHELTQTITPKLCADYWQAFSGATKKPDNFKICAQQPVHVAAWRGKKLLGVIDLRARKVTLADSKNNLLGRQDWIAL